eukprot:scaffold7601_cov417-Prasinococcus_capsulatus_cf.AAC.2
MPAWPAARPHRAHRHDGESGHITALQNLHAHAGLTHQGWGGPGGNGGVEARFSTGVCVMELTQQWRAWSDPLGTARTVAVVTTTPMALRPLAGESLMP